MKTLTMAALVAAQLVAAQPAFAADLGDGGGAATAQRQGAFAGARIRIALDGSRARKAKAGLTIAPIVQGRRADGSIRTRFGEGMELRMAGGDKAQLAFGGRPLAELAEGRTGPDGRKAGLSTIGWVAIGVGVAILTLYAIAQACADGEICGDDNGG
jgi:hypothetical protein